MPKRDLKIACADPGGSNPWQFIESRAREYRVVGERDIGPGRPMNATADDRYVFESYSHEGDTNYLIRERDTGRVVIGHCSASPYMAQMMSAAYRWGLEDACKISGPAGGQGGGE